MENIQRQLLDSPYIVLQQLRAQKKNLKEAFRNIKRQIAETTGAIDVLVTLIKAQDERKKEAEEKEEADAKAKSESGEVAEAVSE